MDLVICRYGEIALKGKNRGTFENQLVDNIRVCLSANAIKAKIKSVRGRILIYTDSADLAASKVKYVFGLVSVSPAFRCEADLDVIKKKSLEIMQEKEFDSFRVTTNRPNKDFEKNSKDVDIEVGALIADTLDKRVSLKEFDIDLGIEIMSECFIFTERLAGPGGLPVGVSGKVLCYVEREQDLLAAWLMMKRGCNVLFAGEKHDLDFLKKYYSTDFELIEDGTLEQIAEENNCSAIILGTTLENIDKEFKIHNQLILYPLISFSDEEINKKLEEIR